MDSASDGASDAGSVMVAGDGSNDDETRVKDTSKKKRPKWSGKKSITRHGYGDTLAMPTQLAMDQQQEGRTDGS